MRRRLFKHVFERRTKSIKFQNPSFKRKKAFFPYWIFPIQNKIWHCYLDIFILLKKEKCSLKPNHASDNLLRDCSLHTVTPSSPLGEQGNHYVLDILWWRTWGGGEGGGGEKIAAVWKTCIDLFSHQLLLVELPSAQLILLFLRRNKGWPGSATGSPSDCKLTCRDDESHRL